MVKKDKNDRSNINFKKTNLINLDNPNPNYLHPISPIKL